MLEAVQALSLRREADMILRSSTFVLLIFFSVAQLFGVKDEVVSDVRTQAQIEADIESEALGQLMPDMVPEEFDELEGHIRCLKNNAPGCLLPPHPIPPEVLDRVLNKILPQARKIYETQGSSGYGLWFELRMQQVERALESAYAGEVEEK